MLHERYSSSPIFSLNTSQYLCTSYIIKILSSLIKSSQQKLQNFWLQPEHSNKLSQAAATFLQAEIQNFVCISISKCQSANAVGGCFNSMCAKFSFWMLSFNKGQQMPKAFGRCSSFKIQILDSHRKRQEAGGCFVTAKQCIRVVGFTKGTLIMGWQRSDPCGELRTRELMGRGKNKQTNRQ